MYRVGIISKQDMHIQKISLWLARQSQFACTHFNQPEASVHALQQNTFDLWIVVLDQATRSQADFILRTIDMVAPKPLIVLAGSIQASFDLRLRSRRDREQKIAVLNKSEEWQALPRVMNLFLEKKDVQGREIIRRPVTEEIISRNLNQGSEPIRLKMLDLSKEGVGFEIPSQTSFVAERGEILSFEVYFPLLHSKRSFKAEIMWASGNKFGAKFLQAPHQPADTVPHLRPAPDLT